MNIHLTRLISILGVATLIISNLWADSGVPTKFTNESSIVNTGHNLTQTASASPTLAGIVMNPYRNNYGEICVYCHTPHAANTDIEAPLWNRSVKNNTYVTYSSRTLTAAVSQPGLNSLTCLSCHDGTLGVDSIINMPGSGLYSAAQQTAQDNTFLNAWNNTQGADASVHLGMSVAGCLACHSASAGIVGAGARSFDVFALGTDLSDNHPVGIGFPSSRVGIDFNATTAQKSSISFYDTDGDGKPDSNEVRYYDTGDGFEVECASCHDPHGVKSGVGNQLNPMFLRRDNKHSALCQTCHAK